MERKEALLGNNILGFYIPELVFGRLTISYERLLVNKSMELKFLVWTYDAIGHWPKLSKYHN